MPPLNSSLHRQPYGWRDRYADLALEMALQAERDRMPQAAEMYLRIAAKLEKEAQA